MTLKQMNAIQFVVEDIQVQYTAATDLSQDGSISSPFIANPLYPEHCSSQGILSQCGSLQEDDYTYAPLGWKPVTGLFNKEDSYS